MPALLLAACDDDAQPTADTGTTGETATTDEIDTTSEPRPMVLDYSTTYSDIGALLYLAEHPGVDLRAVTLPATGEADCTNGTRITRSILASIDQPDVPVGCGVVVPDGANAWPQEWRAAANSLPGVLLRHVPREEPVDAVDLLADVLDDADQPVTIVAVGPLTNVAVLLERDAAYADDIDRVVVMGGAVRVGGNVEGAPTAEWNLYADPASAAAVIGSGVDIVLVPLDATNSVPWDSSLQAQLGVVDSAGGRVEAQMVEARPPFEGLYLWDETAAVVAVNPDVATLEPVVLAVTDDGTTAESDDGTEVQAVLSIDREAVLAEWLRGLNAGVVLTFEPLSAEESAYLEELAAARERLEQELESLYEGEEEPSPVEFVDGLWTGIDAFAADVAALEPPASLVDAHQRLSDGLAALSAAGPDVRAAVESADPAADPFSALETAMQDVGVDGLIADVDHACAAIGDESLRRGGVDVCGSLDDNA